MVRHTISVPESMSQYIESQVSSGQYGSISEFFHDLIRRDQERRQLATHELRKMVDAAEASGASTLSMSNIRTEARREWVYDG